MRRPDDEGLYLVLVTASREWTDARLIRGELAAVLEEARGKGFCPSSVRIIEGAASRGGDNVAYEFAIQAGCLTRRVRPEYSRYGRYAAPVKRNQAMVDMEPDVCLAFIRDESDGATDCYKRAVAAGIDTRPYTLTTWQHLRKTGEQLTIG